MDRLTGAMLDNTAAVVDSDAHKTLFVTDMELLYEPFFFSVALNASSASRSTRVTLVQCHLSTCKHPSCQPATLSESGPKNFQHWY